MANHCTVLWVWYSTLRCNVKSMITVSSCMFVYVCVFGLNARVECGKCIEVCVTVHCSAIALGICKSDGDDTR